MFPKRLSDFAPLTAVVGPIVLAVVAAPQSLQPELSPGVRLGFSLFYIVVGLIVVIAAWRSIVMPMGNFCYLYPSTDDLQKGAEKVRLRARANGTVYMANY